MELEALVVNRHPSPLEHRKSINSTAIQQLAESYLRRVSDRREAFPSTISLFSVFKGTVTRQKNTPVFPVVSEVGFSPVLGLKQPPQPAPAGLAPLAPLRQPQLINV